MSEEIVDFTKFRMRTRPRGLPIGKCPKCGRKGEMNRLPRGGMMIVHKGEIREGGLFLIVTESCTSKDDLQSPAPSSSALPEE